MNKFVLEVFKPLLPNQYKSNLDYLRNYRSVAGKVKEIVVLIDPNAKVYVFGSVTRGCLPLRNFRVKP